MGPNPKQIRGPFTCQTRRLELDALSVNAITASFCNKAQENAARIVTVSTFREVSCFAFSQNDQAPVIGV